MGRPIRTQSAPDSPIQSKTTLGRFGAKMEDTAAASTKAAGTTTGFILRAFLFFCE